MESKIPYLLAPRSSPRSSPRITSLMDGVSPNNNIRVQVCEHHMLQEATLPIYITLDLPVLSLGQEARVRGPFFSSWFVPLLHKNYLEPIITGGTTSRIVAPLVELWHNILFSTASTCINKKNSSLLTKMSVLHFAYTYWCRILNLFPELNNLYSIQASTNSASHFNKYRNLFWTFFHISLSILYLWFHAGDTRPDWREKTRDPETEPECPAA